MSVFLALSPFSAAINTALNVASLLAVAPGGARDSVPQGTAFPCVLFEVSEDDESAFGSRPGSGIGSMVRLRLRCYIYAQYEGQKVNQSILSVLKELLKAPLTVTGYNVPAVFYLQAVPVGDELVAGVKVKELTADWEFYAEEAA